MLMGGRGSVMGGVTGHHSTRERGEQCCVVANAASHQGTRLMGGRGSVMEGDTGHLSTGVRGKQGCVVIRMRDWGRGKLVNVIVSHRSSVELLSVHVCSSIKGGDRRQLYVGEHRDVFSEQRRHSGQRVNALCNILLRERVGGHRVGQRTQSCAVIGNILGDTSECLWEKHRIRITENRRAGTASW
jgi:hypothetical protein